jgi:predicted nucleic acid-binding protein
MKTLADTNFLVALLDRKDSLHRRAAALNEALIAAAAEIFYADCVINETVSVLLRRLREQRREADIPSLVRTIEDQFPSNALTWVYPGIEEEWNAIFEAIRQTNGKLNFHDALLVRAALALRVSHIVSFDSNLDVGTTWKRIGRPDDI